MRRAAADGGDDPQHGSAQSPTIEPDQAFPMALGGRFVVAPAFGKGESMMDAGVQLDLAGGAGTPEQAPQLLNHRQPRQIVMLGAGDVELALALAEEQVRAFLG